MDIPKRIGSNLMVKTSNIVRFIYRTFNKKNVNIIRTTNL